MKEEWITETLGSVLLTLRNGVNCIQDKKGNGHKISRIETISDGTINNEKVGFANLSLSEKEKFKLLKNDILFSHINSSLHVGKTAQIVDDSDIFHGINLLLLRPKEFLNPLYLERYLKFLFIQGYWKLRCKQSVNQASVNQQDIFQVPIVFPRSLAEQKRIVAILDEAFAIIDQAKKNLEKNLQNAKDLFQSKLNTVFSQQGEGWVEMRLGDLCKVIAGQSPEGRFYNVSQLGLPFYQGKKDFGATSIQEPRVWTSKVTKRAFAGDILMSVRAPVGPLNYCTQEVCIGRGLAAIQPGTSVISSFIYCFLLQQEQKISSNPGAVFDSINKNQIESILIPTPPLSEQKRLSSIFELLMIQTKSLENHYCQKLSSLDTLKKSILEKAFKGELKTSEIESVL